MTWPLAAGLTRDIPWDLGDSLLNCWILGWGADHLLRLFTGDAGALAGFWHANIFHPEALALAYSEHLTAQAIQILPIYALTRNLILCYNLVFLSTFVLSGLGVFLLVRELTGSARAAFVAGLIYAFAPYRIGQFSHVQVLSAQWMPFALYGLRRYFESRRRRALAGAVAALVAQNLSCGYFLVYFAPFAAAYGIFELIAQRRWRDGRTWVDLSVAGVATLALTWPFITPYFALRAHGFPRRAVEEVILYSADVYSYLTAHGAQRLYGDWLRAFPKPEGDLFPSLVPVALALIGLWLHTLDGWRRAAAEPPARGWRRWLATVAAVVAITHAAAIVVVLLTGGIILSVGPVPFRASNVARLFYRVVAALTVLAIVSPRARRWLRGTPRSAFAFYALAGVAAFWLSLGPVPRSMDRRIAGSDLYSFFYNYVPGFNGLRVPARYAMLAMLFLAVMAGYGASLLERRVRRGGLVVLLAGLVFLVESTAAPIALNSSFASQGYTSPPGRVMPPARAPDVYRLLATMPGDLVVAEFPFGDDGYELRYMYYSTLHWKRLVNGYSGGFPEGYMRRRALLKGVRAYPDAAWQALVEARVTHAIVHEGAFKQDEGLAISEWLREHGARAVATFGRDRLFELPR